MDDSKPDQKSTLTRESVLIALEALSRELGKHSVHGEMCLFGGTVMMLAMGARVLGALGPGSDGARHGDSNTALLCSPVLQGRFLLMSFKMKILNVASAIMFAAALMVSPLTQSAQAQCSADLNDDHEVDGLDLAAMLSAWGTSGGSTGADINGDSIVDGLDLSFVLGGWGVCPGPTWATVLEWTPDPAVVTNTTLRNAITASGLPWRVRDNASNIEMLLVPAGTFTMGCSASTSSGCGSDESPLHQVTLSAFYIGRYEVTQAQWLAKMGSNPSYFVPANGYSADTTKPVERVSWNMIAAAGGFNSVTGLRLPTEAEWEYAYRAGTTTAFHS